MVGGGVLRKHIKPWACGKPMEHLPKYLTFRKGDKYLQVVAVGVGIANAYWQYVVAVPSHCTQSHLALVAPEVMSYFASR